MKVNVMLLAMVFAWLAGSSAAAAQCRYCSNYCGTVCMDDLSCTNGQPIQCVGGTEPYCPTTPIVIDTQNEGFHLTSIAGGVKFSFNGRQLQSSWTDPHYSNAWLALDRNGNGKIDDATELFGEYTPQPPGRAPNGFNALAVFDDRKNGGNENGRIDPSDAVWPSLRLWVDRNHDGISEPDELMTLSWAGIVSIDLKYELSSRTDQYGNRFRYVAKIHDRYGHDNPVCYDVILMTTPAERPSQRAVDPGDTRDNGH